MSKRRGLSLEEKRDKMLEIFFETQSYFLLKELEKSAPKKGIITQSVKDVLESLIGDDLVMKEKIGTSVYFWSLPSRAVNQLASRKRTLIQELEASKKQKLLAEQQLETCKAGREDSGEREAALAELRGLEERKAKLAAELDCFAGNDPAVVAAMKESAKVAKEAANRWTDNIFSMQQWCSNNFPDARENLESLYKEIGITEDFDYID